MKHMARCSSIMIVCLSTVTTGQVTISVDMDMDQAGIQAARPASIGESFPVGLWIEVEASGLSSYGVSLQFDTVELEPLGPAAASEFLPSGFSFNLSEGVSGLIEDLGNGFGQVNTFEAVTLGNGPAESAFLIGTIDFSVVSVLADGADVMPGLFNLGVDAFFDNAGQRIEPIFNAGSIVPEPTSLIVLLTGAIILIRRG